MKRPELLAPVGDITKLDYALLYGADAVYCGGPAFGLRAGAGNLDETDMRRAVERTHALGKKIYVTLNMIPRDEDYVGLDDYVRFLNEIKVDGVIVADPGIFRLIRNITPEMKITISTQANNTNSGSVAFWREQGAQRIVLARECSFKEVARICERAPEGMEIEVFIHGAMCIGYSGRCLMSHYLTGRNSNQGDCAQPCRWQYHLVEDQRKAYVFDVEDGQKGSYIFNSKDLCLARRIPELMAAGVDSFKIEGRMKSPYYVAVVTRIYRRIIDAVMRDPDFIVPDEWVEELTKVSHRHYTEAFYNGLTSGDDQNYGTSAYTRTTDFIGTVVSYNAETGMALIQQRNKFSVGENIEVVSHQGDALYQCFNLQALYDEQGSPIESAPHAMMLCQMKPGFPVYPMDLLRRVRNEVGSKAN